MKAIIDGKRYDTETETAHEVATWANQLGGSDFGHCCEVLYRTKAGRWFLRGEGGPRTQWKRRCGDMWGSGEGIKPLAEDEAQEWLEAHGKTAALEEHFSDVIEDA